MGSSSSPAKSGLVYRRKERRFYRRGLGGEKWKAARARASGIPLHKMVLQVRIADDDDDPYSDKNRWRRGILEDPDADSW